jgi:hypothetical protein
VADGSVDTVISNSRNALTSSARAQYLFGTSSFVLLVVAVFVTFGCFLVSKRFFPEQFLQLRYEFVQEALALGLVTLAASLILRLYAVLVSFGVMSPVPGVPKSRAAWFLNVASITFVTAAAFTLVVGLHRSHTWWTLAEGLKAAGTAAGAEIVRLAAHNLALETFAMASFFLLFAMFTLIYLLKLRHDEQARGATAA